MGSSKLFKRLGLALTGMALAIGVGVGLNSNNNVARVDAATEAKANVKTTLGSGSGQWNAGSGWSYTSSSEATATDTSSADAAGQTWTVSYQFAAGKYSRTTSDGSIQFGAKTSSLKTPTALSLASSALTSAMKLTAFECKYGGSGAGAASTATLGYNSSSLKTGTGISDANTETLSWTGEQLIDEGGILKVTFSNMTYGTKIYHVQYTLAPAITQHAVNYDDNTNDTVTGMPSAGSANENSTFTLDSSSTPVRAGYTFAGWGTDTDSSTPVATVDVGTSDVTVYAIWKAISGVAVSEKTALTGNMRGQAYYEVQASVSGDTGVGQAVTWSITSSTTYGTGTSIDNIASINGDGKIIFEDNATVYAWATASDGSTHNTTGFVVTASALHGSSTNPYTIVEAKAAIDAGKGLSSVYVSGIISQVDSYNSGAITYWISDDGATTNQFEVYKGKALNNVSFTKQADLQVGDIVTIYGNIKKYGSTYEFDSGNYQTAFKRLDSISLTVSDVQRTFAAGDTFSYAGSVNGNFKNYDGSSAGSSAIDNSKVEFHLGSAGGDVVTTSTVLTRVNNGNSIYVVYLGKSASYNLIVNYGAVSSVTLSSNFATIILGATFDTATITVTVNDTNIANPAYEWDVYTDTTTAKNYTWSAGKLTASAASADAGVVILRAKSTADASKYADFTLTISADPVVHLVNNELSGFVTKTIEVEYDSVENMSAPTSFAWTIITGGDKVSIKEGASSDTLVLNCLAAGSATVKLTVSDGANEAEATANITVAAYVVSSVTWAEPTIKVYTGATLTASAVDDWDVRITSNAGETNKSINHNEFTVKLGGSAIDLPHTWVSADEGKELCVEYCGVSSSTTTVRVAQTLNSISKSNDTSDLVFGASCGGSGTADDGVTWTVTSDADESNFDASRGIHYGTGKKAVQYLQLVSSSFSNTVKRVVVNTTDANGTGSLTVKVGSTSFKCGGENSVTVSSTQRSYIFEGSATGAVTVKVNRASAAVNAIYAKSVIVGYDVSGDPAQIANASGHEDAQYYVVKYAKAFNAAMDTTSNCTTNMESAWATATAAYNTFLSDISDLSAAEQKYAKNLIANATAQWTADTDSNYAYCLERAMKTYDVCVSQHGLSAFMSELRATPAAARINNGNAVDSGNDSSILISIIIPLTGLLTVGGYFFIRRRKER